MWLAQTCFVLSILLIAVGSGVLFARAVRRQIRAELKRARGRPRAIGRRLQSAVLVFLVGSFAGAWLLSGSARVAAWTLPLALVFVVGWIAVRTAGERRRLEAEALAHWHALRGFVAAGVSLPHALFRLARPEENRYAHRLRAALERYEGGAPLTACLARFRARLPLRLSGTCLVAIEVAYAQGLPLVPLLDEVLPLLEWEREAETRRRDLRKGALAQSVFAALLPWAVLAASHAIAPEFLSSETLATPAFAGLAGAVLVTEGLGVAVLWKLSAFY